MWLNSHSTSITVTRSQVLTWEASLATALKFLRIKNGNVIVLFSHNHIYIPVAFVSTDSLSIYSFPLLNPRFAAALEPLLWLTS
jgi:hypothetical protein